MNADRVKLEILWMGHQRHASTKPFIVKVRSGLPFVSPKPEGLYWHWELETDGKKYPVSALMPTISE